MKKLGIMVAAAVASCGVQAALEVVSPAERQVVRLLPECQVAVLTNAERSVREQTMPAWKASKEWRQSEPLALTWRMTAGEKGPWKIEIAKSETMDDARVWFVSDGHKAKKAETRTHAIPDANLEIGTTYYWRVSNIGKERSAGERSGVGVFVTEALAPRWIAVEGTSVRTVKNFRDLGGRIGLDGRQVRQGMVYRSQGLNDNSVDGVIPGKNRLSVEDVKYLTGTLGIKTDLDLRSRGETAGMTNSPLGAKVKFVWHSSSAYKDIFSKGGKKVMAENFRVFCDPTNYPILFHCIAGADRTGALAYVLNGVLGVPRAQLETDWESTFYPNVPKFDKHHKDGLAWNSERHFDNGFGAYGTADTPWNEKICLYLKDCGITDEEIAKFRSIMLK